MSRLPLFLAVVLLASLDPNRCLAASPGLAFRAAGTGFAFDTGTVRGKLRGGDKAQGITSLVHVPTGTEMARGSGILSHYRVFSAGQRYGTAAWDWPGTAALRDDGSVVAVWPAAGDRLFELQATYRWIAADTLEVETAVTARTNLAGFESFLACYFSPAFTNAQMHTRLAKGGPDWTELKPELGLWLVSPRDEASLKIVQDGRWKLEPHPVDWVPLPAFGAPISLRKAPANGLAAVLLSRPGDCFAVFSPHQLESHFSMYHSLFGRDLKAGETRRARSRLWITTNPTPEQIRSLRGGSQ